MPVSVEFRGGNRPWKLVERDGTVVGSSVTREKAEAAARARNAATEGKK
ncbi:hypothetical protein LCGC14_0824870 [marine sediment metagenome]|uniref:DUF2188 domain-containing protein n=1 Tax=marine sediment metagenome TaxID=412755 RepID=A0A0F9Q2Y3_9ZZZZ